MDVGESEGAVVEGEALGEVEGVAVALVGESEGDALGEREGVVLGILVGRVGHLVGDGVGR